MNRYLIVAFLLFSLTSFGQVTIDSVVKKNTFFTEFLGHSRSMISVNYERIFNFSNNHFLYTFRAGVGYIPGSSESKPQRRGIVTIPVVASVLAGGKAGYAQLGVGYSYSFGESYIDSTENPPHIFQKYEPAYSLSLGYRLMLKNIVIQAFPMLVWTNNPSRRFSVLGGFAIGGSF